MRGFGVEGGCSAIDCDYARCCRRGSHRSLHPRCRGVGQDEQVQRGTPLRKREKTERPVEREVRRGVLEMVRLLGVMR